MRRATKKEEKKKEGQELRTELRMVRPRTKLEEKSKKTQNTNGKRKDLIVDTHAKQGTRFPCTDRAHDQCPKPTSVITAI